MQTSLKAQNKPQKHIHIVGICGVATSALAIAFKDFGFKVTGSDKGFFPPVSTELEKHGIDFYAGWHPDKMIGNGKPDLVVITTFAGTQNPEIKYAQENKIPTAPYMEVFRDYFIRKNSIVCAGTWGKSSSSSLLSFILEHAGMNPTYMFGGVSLSHNASAQIKNSDWSIFEGDEYKSSPTDNTPKFAYYKPTHLLLTSVSWDHADLYPTEASYFDAFKKLVASIPKNGLIVANKDNSGVKKILDKAVWYGKADADYTYSDVKETKSGLNFKIEHANMATNEKVDKSYEIHSPLIGAFQAENITACFALSCEIGIPTEKIIEAIAKFKGLRRRLEKRFEGDVTVIDDIAHSPEKASSVLKCLRGIYTGKIIAVFEPNIGGRKIEALKKYTGAFDKADTVIIPRLTKLKVGDEDKPIDGDDLAKAISLTHKDVAYIDDDNKLVANLLNTAKKDDVIVFLGSHGFRGMIEQTIEALSK